MHIFQFRIQKMALWLLLMALVSACTGAASSSDLADVSPENRNISDAQAAVSALQATEEPLAARVNGQPITLAAFERERARYMLGMENEPATITALEASILQNMIDQVLIEQAAAREGVVVTEAEIDHELALQAELAASNNQTLDLILAAQLYTMDEYRVALRSILFAQKMSNVVATVPSYTTQVHARHILVKDEALALDLLAQIQQGADFAQLAIQYSVEDASARAGGDLSWVSQGDLIQPEIDAIIFSLAPGTMAPTPVQSSLGYHIIQVLERVEDHPLSPADLAKKRQQKFNTWLINQNENAVIERYIGMEN